MASAIVSGCFFCFGVVLASGVHVRGKTDVGAGVLARLSDGGTGGEVQPTDSGVCFKNTGGTCRQDSCLETRGPTECINGHCSCTPGFCSNTSGICTPREGRRIGSHAIRSLTRGFGNGFGARRKYLGVERGIKPCNQGGDACFPTGPDYYITIADAPQQWLFWETGDGYVRIESVVAPGYWLSTIPILSVALKSGKGYYPANALHSSWKVTGDQDNGYKIVEAKGFLHVYMNSFRLLPRMSSYVVAGAAYVGFIIFCFLIALCSFRCVPKAAFRCWIVFVITFMLVFLWWALLWFDPDCGVGICLGDISCMGRQEFLFEPPIDPGIVDGDGVWTKPTVVGIFGDAWKVVPTALFCLVLLCCFYVLFVYCIMSYTSVPTTDQKDAKENNMDDGKEAKAGGAIDKESADKAEGE